MIRFIWNSWWRNKGRFILLLAGALIISTGLSYLVGTSQANNGTIVDELQNRWDSSYHIVVRPPDTKSVTEELGLLEPNYQSGLAGGISLDQYEKIKSMGDIEVAAPIAMLGYALNTTTEKRLEFKENGFYRLQQIMKADNGIGSATTVDFITYWSKGIAEVSGIGNKYGAYNANEPFMVDNGSYVLLAGIDPEAEAALVGLDKAVIKEGHSRYFSKDDKAATYDNGFGIPITNIPLLISNQEYVDMTMVYKLSKLDMDFTPEGKNKTLESIRLNGNETYLAKQKAIEVDSFETNSIEAHKKYIDQILKPSSGISETTKFMNSNLVFNLRPSALNHKPVESPFKERWPYAYELEIFEPVKNSEYFDEYTYRPINALGEPDQAEGWKHFSMDVIGVYDPGELAISKDPLTELPMETYFPAKATHVMDRDGNPVNPPSNIKPEFDPQGFLTAPPSMLTTIDAASQLLGDDDVISSIRIKVSGVDDISDESAAILEGVSERIEKETGLMADITLGSSPQPTVTYIPGINGKKSIGWIEQPWIKLGASMAIFREAKIGLNGIIASVILVAIMYVFSSSLVMMYTRRKEFAVLQAIGWRPGQLSKMLLIEATILGLFVSVVSWLILGYIYISSEIDTSLVRMIMVGLFGLLVYWLGMIIPVMLVHRIKPFEAMKTGEISSAGRRWIPVKSIWSMSLQHLLGKWKRSVLSIISIALPTSLFIIFLFITFHLKGVMFTTWLGQYVAMEVSSMHYIAMGVALLIAILTTTEIIWQNVSERQPEIALLKSVGWHNRSVYWIVLLEGIFIGLIAGVAAILLALGIVWKMYGELPVEQIPFFLISIVIPILTGMAGAFIPASRAIRIRPNQGLAGMADNSGSSERHFKFAFLVVGAILFVGMITLLVKAIPEMEKTVPSTADTEGVKGTEGTISEESMDKGKGQERNLQEIHSDNGEMGERKLGDLYDDAWITIDLGDTEPGVNDQHIIRKITSSTNVSDKKPAVQMEYVGIQVDLSVPVDSYSLPISKTGYTMFDGLGNEYPPVDGKVTKEKEWNGAQLHPGGEVQFLFTFEVPKESSTLLLKCDYLFEPGPILITVRSEDKAE